MTLKERLQLRKRLMERQALQQNNPSPNIPDPADVDPNAPLPQPDLTQQYPEGAVEARNVSGQAATPNQYPTVADLPYEGIAETAGAGIGGMIGGPPGAAAGYALSDLLYDKYNKGQTITPSSAAGSLATGAAMEMLPFGIAKGLGGTSQKLGKLLYQKAYRPSLSAAPNAAKMDEALDFGMRNRILPTAKGLESNTERIKQLTSQVDNYIDRATEAGKTLKTDDVLAYVRSSEGSRALNDPGFGDGRIKALDKFYENVKNRYGKEMTPTDLQATKREYSKLLADAYDRNIKSAKTRTMKDYTYGAKSELEGVAPEIRPLNEEASNRITLNNMLAGRLRQAQNQPAVGFQDMVRLSIGGPAFAVTGRALNVPAGVAGAGMTARNVGRATSAAAPPSGIPTLLSQSLKEKRVREE